MGRLQFTGLNTASFLDTMVTRRVKDLKVGQIRYALVTNAQGGILDDVLVYRLADADGEPCWMLVVNGANRDKIVAWLDDHLPRFPSVRMTDVTLKTAMIAVQGPAAVGLVHTVTGEDVSQLRYYRGTRVNAEGVDALVSRTGYTGEDGCELIVPEDSAAGVWQQLMDTGRSVGAVPAGLGARDTLRLEAGMPLYGHELTESVDPFRAGLDFAVQLQDRDFVGREALVAIRRQDADTCRVGLMLEGRRPARQDNAVLAGEESVGTVTSGSFSPTLERPIAMAYVQPRVAAVGTSLTVDIRGHRAVAEVVGLPFYTRS